MSPTQRSLAALRAAGYGPWIVEVWNPHSRTRRDLWNFGDIIAIREGDPPLIVQTTSYSGVSARLKKILAEPLARVWLTTGGHIEVHGWHKKPERPGSKRLRWTCRVVPVTLSDFGETQ